MTAIRRDLILHRPVELPERTEKVDSVASIMDPANDTSDDLTYGGSLYPSDVEQKSWHRGPRWVYSTDGLGEDKGTRVYDVNGPMITCTTGMHPWSPGYATGLYTRGGGSLPRRLAAVEAARAMGLDWRAMRDFQREGLLSEGECLALVGNAMEARSLLAVLKALDRAMGPGGAGRG